MTRRPYSDSTLDALAAAPDRSLAKRIEDLREDYRAEVDGDRMTSVQPPVTRRVTEYAPGRFDVELEQEPADRSGRNLSSAMVSLIGGIVGRHDRDACPECQSSSKAHDQETGYGPRHLVRSSMTQWERKCRRLHARWADHRGRPICGELAWWVIREGTSIEWASDQVGVSFPRGERLMEMAVEYIERGIERSEAPAESTHDRERCHICRVDSYDRAS